MQETDIRDLKDACPHLQWEQGGSLSFPALDGTCNIFVVWFVLPRAIMHRVCSLEIKVVTSILPKFSSLFSLWPNHNQC